MIASRFVARRLAARVRRRFGVAGAVVAALASVDAAAASLMVEGAERTGPRGFYELCARAPEICPATMRHDGPTMIRHSDRIAATLDRINREINAKYQPMTDAEAHNISDHWQLPSVTADCEDYVIAKRAALIARGWPPEALLIGVVRGTTSPYHAVLLVRTDRGAMVLDNLADDVRHWTDTGYQWVVRQSQYDSFKWVRISGRKRAPAPGFDAAGVASLR